MARSFVTLAACAALTASPGFAGSSPADPRNSAQVARGAGLYAEACASCHGAELQGRPDWQSQAPDGTYPAPPQDGEGHTWHHPDRLLFRYIKLGGAEAFKDLAGFKSAMPGFGERLTDQQIWDVIAFIKSNWPERARAYQEAVTENDN